jgi:hypothetical protein
VELQPSGLTALESTWAHQAVLCQVHRPPQGLPNLELKLSVSHPVAAPMV